MLERLSATIRIIYNYTQTLPNADEMIKISAAISCKNYEDKAR
jgi:hypothetical protein